jgi:hypothetical protein
MVWKSKSDYRDCGVYYRYCGGRWGLFCVCEGIDGRRESLSRRANCPFERFMEWKGVRESINGMHLNIRDR